MLKRALIILTLALTLVIAFEPAQTVQGIIMTHAEMMALEASDVDGKNGQQVQLENGNGFVKALGAPFRAIRRLFGGGKKKKNRVERISQKDIEKFETAKPAHVNQSQTEQAKGMLVTPPSSLAQQSPQATINANPVVTPASLASQHLEKGRAFLNVHDLNAAIAELSSAVSLDPKLGEASSLLGVAYWRKGLRGQAQSSLEAAVKTEQYNPQLLNNLGYLLYEMGEYDDAAKHLKRATKLAPQDARILNNLALTQVERGNYDDAYESFARAQGEYKGHLNVAARLERRGSTKKAIKHLEKAMKIQPNSPDVLAKLIELYDQNGNERQALSARNTLETLRTVAKTADK